jgi:hypothetical protein
MEREINVTSPAEIESEKEFSVEEFSITELEERLELVGRCNGSCKGSD